MPGSGSWNSGRRFERLDRGDAVAEFHPGCRGLGNRLCGVLRAGRPWALVRSAESATGERRSRRGAQRRTRPARRWLLSPRWLAVLAVERRPAFGVALASRDVIGQAKGILMERFQISSDEAFRMLVRWSQNSNVKVRAVTAQLVWSGELPMGGGASRRTAQGAAGLNASGLLRRPARAEEKEWREMTTPWGGEPRLKVQMRRQKNIRCASSALPGATVGYEVVDMHRGWGAVTG